MKITKTSLENYKYIYALNGFSISSKQNSLYKYTCFGSVIRTVESEELVFVSPMKWKDPFERRFYKTDYSGFGFERPDIACMCLTNKSTTNEEASWKMYVTPNDKALRLTYDFSVLCSFLEKYAEANQCTVYIGKVIYDFDKKEIEILHKPGKVNNAMYDVFFPSDSFGIEHYLSLMLIKRKSFQFENEVRIFVVKEGSLDFDKDNLLRINGVDYDKTKLVSQIMIAPYEPLPDNDIMTPLRNKINSIESAEYKKILSAKVGCVVKQSQLYANCNPLLKV